MGEIMIMNAIAHQLRTLIDAIRPRLLAIPEAAASAKPNPEKWCLKEILGHLIDSAANNHQRIVRMQQSADIGTFTYDQQHWVSSQRYGGESWLSVVEFWYRYNSHLAHIIEHVDPGTLEHVCDMGYSNPATLKFVIEDYIRHVQHHVDQVFEDADPAKRRQWVTREPK